MYNFGFYLYIIVFPDNKFEDSQSSSDEEVDLSECLNPVKNLLSLEKKLFVSRCPSKNT